MRKEKVHRLPAPPSLTYPQSQQTGFESFPAFHWLVSTHLSVYKHGQVCACLLLSEHNLTFLAFLNLLLLLNYSS